MSESAMDKFDDIWLFVEQKLQTNVPTYLKNILKVCGYDNGLSIASIEEPDIKYFESEVQNGKVSRYFKGNKDVLEGSNKGVENFEFSRGHRRFLLYIADLLQNHLKENRQNPFVTEVRSKKLDTCAKKQPAEKERFDSCNGTSENIDNKQTRIRNRLLKLSNGNQTELQNFDLKIHKGFLICKVIMSLIDIVPEMYAENMESINKKILIDFIEVKKLVNDTQTVKEYVDEYNETTVLEAIVKCPFCLKAVTAFPNTNESTYSWSILNLDEHLNNTHLIQIDKTKKINVDQVHDLHCESTEPGAISFIPEEISSVIYPNNQTQSECHEKHNKISLRKISTPPKASNVECEDQISCESWKQSNYLESHSHVSSEQKTPLMKEKITNIFEGNRPAKEHSKQTIDVILPKEGNYVICSLAINSSMQWPSKTKSKTQIVKNFIGHVCRLNESGLSNESEEIELTFLRKSPYSKFIFRNPEKLEISHVSKAEIVKILNNPYQNRRGELVFEDKAVLEYIF